MGDETVKQIINFLPLFEEKEFLELAKAYLKKKENLKKFTFSLDSVKAKGYDQRIVAAIESLYSNASAEEIERIQAAVKSLPNVNNDGFVTRAKLIVGTLDSNNQKEELVSFLTFLGVPKDRVDVIRSMDTDSAPWDGAIVVPLKNPNSHNYELGLPVRHFRDRYFHHFRYPSTEGNNMPFALDAWRFADEIECLAYYWITKEF